MKVVVVFNHPYEGSYCNAILQSVIRGLQKANHEIDVMHLDNDNFDPVMRAKDLAAFAQAKRLGEKISEHLDPLVLDYKRRLLQADYLIFIFPIWWELMPALTKGFIDKLIFPTIAYGYKDGTDKMEKYLTKLKGMTMITTQNTPAFVYRIAFGNAIRKAVLLGTFWKIGVKNRKWLSLTMVKFVSDRKRKKWLEKIEKRFAVLS